MRAFNPTATTHRPGAATLPRELYLSAEVLAEETERIFARRWTCVGRASRVAEPGAYFLATVAGESLIVLRDRHRLLRALFNVCRHRGTRICMEESGAFSETIQCPYHAWTWTTDGRLIGAPHMQDVADFDKQDYPLHAVVFTARRGETKIVERPFGRPKVSLLRHFLQSARQLGSIAVLEHRRQIVPFFAV